MTNTYINHYNKKKKTPVHQELNNELCQDSSNNLRKTEDPLAVDDEKLLNYYVSDHVKKAINSLPGEYRVIPTHAEEMYFPEVFGRGDGGLFRVTE